MSPDVSTPARTALADRVAAFRDRFGLTVPIVAAPMAGACPPALAAAVAGAGGLGAGGMVLTPPEGIADWVRDVRARTDGPFQLNLWIPDPPVADDDPAVLAARDVLDRYGTPGPEGDPPPDFAAQRDAVLAARPAVASSIMGLFDPATVAELRSRGIAWFACATGLREALAAQEAGADAVVAQGVEAGGHRGSFEAADGGRGGVGTLALVPQLADRLSVPVIAAGGIADARGVAAALALGASAVQVGTAYLACPEAGVDAGWPRRLAGAAPEDSVLTRAYSGRAGRALATPFVRVWEGPDATPPAPYPHQRALVARYRRGGAPEVDPVNLWAGQAAALAAPVPAAVLTAALWDGARELLALP